MSVLIPSLVGLWIVFFLPPFALFLWLFWQDAGKRTILLLTNYRVVRASFNGFKAIVTSIPYPQISELKENSSAGSIEFCASPPSTGLHLVKFETLPLAEWTEAMDISQRALRENPPVDFVPSFSSMKHDINQLSTSYRNLVESYSPFIWAHKPSRFQVMKRVLLMGLVGLLWNCFIVGYCLNWTHLELVLPVAIVLHIFLVLFFLTFFHCWDSFQALSDKGIIEVRTGFHPVLGCSGLHNCTVIPYSKAFPLTSIFSLEDGSGTSIFPIGYSVHSVGPFPEVLVREEIIFKHYLDSLSQ